MDHNLKSGEPVQAFAGNKQKLSTKLGKVCYQKIFIHGFSRKQDGFIFHPHADDIEPLMSPDVYDALKPYHVTERTLVTDKKYNVIPKATITLWEKKAAPGKPHVFYFAGRTGHVADTGSAHDHVEGYDRHGGLRFLAELAKSGAGFTAVTMSGYGNNKGRPGEDAFRKDIKALVDDWMAQKDRTQADHVIVTGYSLGAANAAIMASELTKRGEPPAMIELANGFSSMIKRGKEFIDVYLRNSQNPHFRALEISEDTVRDRMLRHPFNTEERIAELDPSTRVCIAYSSDDRLTDNSHSKRLADIARKTHQVAETCFEGYGHLNVPPELIAQSILGNFAKIGKGRQVEPGAKQPGEKRQHAPTVPAYRTANNASPELTR